jgi:hypothetical protein
MMLKPEQSEGKDEEIWSIFFQVMSFSSESFNKSLILAIVPESHLISIIRSNVLDFEIPHFL